jgi:hypothetical protein
MTRCRVLLEEDVEQGSSGARSCISGVEFALV